MGLLYKWITRHAEHTDDFISEWYWRKKYNSKCLELDDLKEVMTSDIYAKVVKNMVDPMENKRLKQQVRRLNRLLEAARDERDFYKNKCKGKKVSIYAAKGKVVK